MTHHDTPRRHTSQRLEWTRCIGRCSELPLNLRALAWALAVFMDAEGAAPGSARPGAKGPGLETIGRTMGVSASTVQRLRPKLVDAGWLEHSTTRGGRHQTSSYRALIPSHLCDRVSVRKPSHIDVRNPVRFVDDPLKPTRLGDQGSTELQVQEGRVIVDGRSPADDGLPRGRATSAARTHAYAEQLREHGL